MSVADDLTAAIAPWWTSDLEDYVEVIGGMFAEVEAYAVGEDDGITGWSTLFNPATCPVAALPYLASLRGERLPAGLSEADSRRWIIAAPNQFRGSANGIAAAAQRHLTGHKTVMMGERLKPDGTVSVDDLTIVTLAGETPSSTVTQADILSVMPADIVLHYTTLAGAIWSQVLAAHATWALVKTADTTWTVVSGETGVIAGWRTWTV